MFCRGKSTNKHHWVTIPTSISLYPPCLLVCPNCHLSLMMMFVKGTAFFCQLKIPQKTCDKIPKINMDDENWTFARKKMAHFNQTAAVWLFAFWKNQNTFCFHFQTNKKSLVVCHTHTHNHHVNGREKKKHSTRAKKPFAKIRAQAVQTSQPNQNSWTKKTFLKRTKISQVFISIWLG